MRIHRVSKVFELYIFLFFLFFLWISSHACSTDRLFSNARYLTFLNASFYQPDISLYVISLHSSYFMSIFYSIFLNLLTFKNVNYE